MDTSLPWVRCADRLPDAAGVFLIYASSADPDSPLYMTGWYEPGASQQWSPLPVGWADAVSHWLKPTPPSEQ